MCNLHFKLELKLLHGTTLILRTNITEWIVEIRIIYIRLNYQFGPKLF